MPAENTKNRNYDKKLEGLRAICALVVAGAHFFNFKFFCSGNISFNNMSPHLEFAHEAVLIFFIISGYVIGMHHINTPFNYGNIVSYLKKRAIRLYPIYLLALAISFALIFPRFSAKQLIGHIFFSQEFLVGTITTNVVLWSLSYEVIYYILFIGLWMAKKYNVYLCLGLSIAIMIYVLSTPDMTAIKALLTGWIFWMAGLYIAQKPVIVKPGNKKIIKPVISYFALILAIHNLGTGSFILRFMHLNPNYVYKIGVGDILFLPICAIIILEITNRQFKFINYLKVAAYAIPALNIFILLYFRHPIASNSYWAFGVLFFIVAVITFPMKINLNILEKLNYIGRSSYAIYVFHFPIAIFLNILLSKYLSGYPLFVTGLVCWIALTFTLSVFAEIKLQPYIKRYFLKRSLVLP